MIRSIPLLKKGITVFHPFQWVTLVQGACKIRPYIVEAMGTDDFLSFETSLDEEYAILIKNLPKEIEQEKTKKIKWSEIRAVIIEAKQPFTMLFKYDLVVPWQCGDVGRAGFQECYQTLSSGSINTRKNSFI